MCEMKKRLWFLEKQSPLAYSLTPTQTRPHSPIHPLPPTSYPSIYNGNNQCVFFLPIEIANAYDWTIQISTTMNFVMVMWNAFDIWISTLICSGVLLWFYSNLERLSLYAFYNGGSLLWKWHHFVFSLYSVSTNSSTVY